VTGPGHLCIDERERLMGAISLGVLIRHITSARHRPQFHVRTLLDRITSVKLADLMEGMSFSPGKGTI
jgi:hypothetical protein